MSLAGKTLWQAIRDWWRKEEVRKPYNPLNAGPAVSLTVKTPELSKYLFVIKDLKEYGLSYGGKTFYFADYFCRSTLQEGEPVEVKVRVYPHEEAGRDLQILVLKVWDVVEYDDEFKSLLDDQQFNTMVDGETEAAFWRINDVKTPYEAVVTCEGVESRVTYWDYWRETLDEANSPYKEFLFVEWDKGDTGRFTVWRGEELPKNYISV